MLAQNKLAYSFPELKNKEIIQCMASLQIPISEQELSKPRPQIVQLILEFFIEMFMGISKEEYAQPGFDGIASLEYPEFIMETNVLVSLAEYSRQLMVNAGVDDFSIRDLIRPESSRVKCQLSALINFAKFREEQLAVFERISSRSESIQKERADLIEKADKLERQIENAQRKKQKEEEEAAQMQPAISKQHEELKRVQKEQQNVHGQFEEIKEKRNQLSKKIEDKKETISRLEKSCAQLKKRVVVSPERLALLLEEMKTFAVSEASTITELEKRRLFLDRENDLLKTAGDDLAKCIQFFSNYKTEMVKKTKTGDEIRMMEEEKEIKETKLEELSLFFSQIAKQAQSTEEKLETLRERQEQRRKAIEEKLSELQNTYQGVSQEKRELDSKQAAMEREIKEIEGRMDEAKRMHESEIGGFINDILAFQRQTQFYISQIKKKISN